MWAFLCVVTVCASLLTALSWKLKLDVLKHQAMPKLEIEKKVSDLEARIHSIELQRMMR